MNSKLYNHGIGAGHSWDNLMDKINLERTDYVELIKKFSGKYILLGGYVFYLTNFNVINRLDLATKETINTTIVSTVTNIKAGTDFIAVYTSSNCYKLNENLNILATYTLATIPTEIRGLDSQLSNGLIYSYNDSTNILTAKDLTGAIKYTYQFPKHETYAVNWETINNIFYFNNIVFADIKKWNRPSHNADITNKGYFLVKLDAQLNRIEEFEQPYPVRNMFCIYKKQMLYTTQLNSILLDDFAICLLNVNGSVTRYRKSNINLFGQKNTATPIISNVHIVNNIMYYTVENIVNQTTYYDLRCIDISK